MSEGNGIGEDVMEALKDAFEDVAKDALKGAQGDIKAYAKDLARDYWACLVGSVKDKDAARRNIDHLRAQVLLIAVKRKIIIARELQQRVMDMAVMLAQFGISTAMAMATRR